MFVNDDENTVGWTGRVKANEFGRKKKEERERERRREERRVSYGTTLLAICLPESFWNTGLEHRIGSTIHRNRE